MRDTVTPDRPRGFLYQLLLLARHQATGEECVVYIPLRVEPEWAGTVRPCVIPRGDWDWKFEFIGEGLPTPSSANESPAVRDVTEARTIRARGISQVPRAQPPRQQSQLVTTRP